MRALQDVNEVRTLACHPSFALISTFVPGLPQTVLVQLAATTFGWRRRFSVYLVYREAGMTFDAIAALSLEPAAGRLDELLAPFMQSKEFADLLLQPLVTKVRRHFRR